MSFPIHSIDSAPEDAHPILNNAGKAFGFIPNLLAGMASSPALLEGYVTLSGIFEKTSFNATEQQIVLLTTSRYNECHYCMAAHTGIAGMQGVDADVIAAIRNDQPIADSRLEALRILTHKIVENRGWVAEKDLAPFFAAGFNNGQVLEVVLGVGLKTLSNYANHLLSTPVDEAFEAHSWTPAPD